jgi:integrase/recombinase XerD
MAKYTRKEMREVMEVRGYSERTISIYTYHMANLAEYFNKAPHTIKAEDIHAYQVYLVQEKQVSWTFFNQAVCAMRFFLTML